MAYEHLKTGRKSYGKVPEMLTGSRFAGRNWRAKKVSTLFLSFAAYRNGLRFVE